MAWLASSKTRASEPRRSCASAHVEEIPKLPPSLSVTLCVASVAVTETTTFVVEHRKPSHTNMLVEEPPVTPLSAHTEVNRSSYGLLSNTSSLCLLQIRHVAAKRNGRARNLSWSSRVRVDSLVLSSLATTNLSQAVACPSILACVPPILCDEFETYPKNEYGLFLLCT